MALNLSKQYTEVTLAYARVHVPYILCVCQGGSVIQLHHKVLESYLVAEGLFDDSVTEDS